MFQTGGFPDLDLSVLFCPSLSFFCPFFCPFLSFFRDFRDFSGIFPICSGMVRGFSRFVLFSLSRPIKSTYEEQSRKGPRHNLDLSQKKWGTPGFGNPPVKLLSKCAGQPLLMASAHASKRVAYSGLPLDGPIRANRFADSIRANRLILANLSAAPRQSEICVKFSVFHTVFVVKFW